MHAFEPLDVLAFGERSDDENVGFPRLGMSYVGSRMVGSLPGVINGVSTQFVLEGQLGPPPLPLEPAPRPPTIVNVEDVEAVTVERPRVVRTRRNLGRAAGSITTGIQHVEVAPGKESAPPHCHSLEEEIFVILDGDGVLVLGDEETTVRAGHVISRPAGTGVAHMFRGGPSGLTYLAYGMRHNGDVCYYPPLEQDRVQGCPPDRSAGAARLLGRGRLILRLVIAHADGRGRRGEHSSSCSTRAASARCPTPPTTATRAPTRSATWPSAAGGLALPTLARLGLGSIVELEGVPPAASPVLHGRLDALGPGKDSTAGHWGLMGVVAREALPTYPDGFPTEIVALVSGGERPGRDLQPPL